MPHHDHLHREVMDAGHAQAALERKEGAECGRASRDAEVVGLREQLAEAQAANAEQVELLGQINAIAAEARATVESERTRADKAEAEVARLREVVEQVRSMAEDNRSDPDQHVTDYEDSYAAAADDLIEILAAVPVEPQGDHEGGQ